MQTLQKYVIAAALYKKLHWQGQTIALIMTQSWVNVTCYSSYMIFGDVVWVVW